MRLPELTEMATAKDNTEEFKGYNHNLRNEVGEWYDQKNMTTDYYPAASPRDKRAKQMKMDHVAYTYNNISYKIMGFLGMAYTDNQLIILQQIINSSTNLQRHCWFTNNNSLVGFNYSGENYTFNNIAVTITTTGEGYGGYKYQCVLNIVSSAHGLAVGDYVNITLTSVNKRISAVVTSITSDQIVAKYGDPTAFPFYIDDLDDDTIYSGTYSTVTVVNKGQQSTVWATMFGNSVFNASDAIRSVVRMGSYVCVFPDGVIYETKNTKSTVPIFKIQEGKSLSFVTNNLNQKAKIRFCFGVKAENKSGYDVSKNIDDKNYRISNGQLQKYLTDNSLWVNESAYTLIYYSTYENSGSDVPKVENVFAPFKKGDTISIKINDTPESNNEIKGIISANSDMTEYIEVTRKILDTGKWPDGREFIVVEGLTYAEVTSGNTASKLRYHDAESVTLTRKCPNIAFACESQNRIWCCSEDGHEIYASALGDPYNFYDYSGIATDSYAVNVGTDGEFTGCINYMGQPLFFKENALHYISGSYPSNNGNMDGMSYAVTTTTEFKGVEKGSDKSLVVIDNILYYKSSVGIVAFDGVNTVVISNELGKEKYKNAVAGAYNNKYYVSMQDSKGIYHLFVYDTRLGTWSKEDNTQVLQFLSVNNELLYVNATENKVYSISEENVLELPEYEKESDFEWECETGNFGYSYPNNKYLSRFQVRMQIADGAKASVYIQYNSDGIWHRKGEMTGKGIRTHLIPIVPIRCDHMKIKFSGKGDVKIYSIAKTFEEGGDV